MPRDTRDYSCQTGILDPKNINWPITVIGLGGLGNPAVQIIAGTGAPEMILIDGDKVEEHNRASQGYRKADLGKPKVEAARDIILEFNEGCNVKILNEFYTDQPLSGIVVSAVDSMEARKQIWENIRWNNEVVLYIDSRMLSRYFEAHAVLPCQLESIEMYEKTLFDPKDADIGTCTTKGIKYVGTALGSIVASQIQKWIKGESLVQETGFDFVTMTLFKDKKF